MNDFTQLKENTNDFAVSCMLNYQRVYKLLVKELDKKEINEHALYGYHSMAYSSYKAMKTYYLLNDSLGHQEFDDFFEKAGNFSREFTSSRETKHSMQYTFFYYGELVQAYNRLANLLGANPFDVPQ
ncbi:hypothetical protein [Rossellomorea marisflavi]|uniref:hypothetical protein n=1 Tax=Rossellomorea marisflavi TaxID=189381 RepID=UPI0034584C99